MVKKQDGKETRQQKEQWGWGLDATRRVGGRVGQNLKKDGGKGG